MVDLLGDAADAVGDAASGLRARLAAMGSEAAARRRRWRAGEMDGGGQSGGARQDLRVLHAFGSAVGEEAAATGAVASVLPLAADERSAGMSNSGSTAAVPWREALAADGDEASEALVAAALTSSAVAAAAARGTAAAAACVAVGAEHFEEGALPRDVLEGALRELAAEDSRASEAAGAAAGLCLCAPSVRPDTNPHGPAPFVLQSRAPSSAREPPPAWSVAHRVALLQAIVHHCRWGSSSARGVAATNAAPAAAAARA